MEEEVAITCSHCGEEIWLLVDPTGGSEQSYVEDCSVCCRPMTIRVHVGAEGEVQVWSDAA